MEQYMWIVWLVAFIVFIIIETVGTDLVTVWFAIGSVIALIVSFIPNVPWWVEVIIFLAISITCLLALRPLSRKYLRGTIVKSNADALIGRKGMLLEPIGPLQRGVVQLGDVKWTAVGMEEGDKIASGAIVEIVAISGNKLIVRPASEDK